MFKWNEPPLNHFIVSKLDQLIQCFVSVFNSVLECLSTCSPNTCRLVDGEIWWQVWFLFFFFFRETQFVVPFFLLGQFPLFCRPCAWRTHVHFAPMRLVYTNAASLLNNVVPLGEWTVLKKCVHFTAELPLVNLHSVPASESTVLTVYEEQDISLVKYITA